jgi:hypothetical protein
MPDQDAWGVMTIPFYGWFYRMLMRLAHRYDWYHARVCGPFEDGRYQRWCRWCGLRESYVHDPRKPLRGPLRPHGDLPTDADLKSKSVRIRF